MHGCSILSAPPMSCALSHKNFIMKAFQSGLAFLLFVVAHVSANASPCSPDTAPSDSYSSVVAPCELTFFQNDAMSSQNTSLTSCDELEWESLVRGERSQHLAFWPDRCVGDLQRCYKIFNIDSLLRVSLTTISNIPEHTTHIKVDCTRTEELPQNHDSKSKDKNALVAVIAVVFLVFTCGCLCRRKGFCCKTERTTIPVTASGSDLTFT